MVTKDQFNVSGSADAAQISAKEAAKRKEFAEQQRQQKINKIRDDATRRKANTMLNDRDVLEDQLSAQAEQKISQVADEEIRKKIRPSPEHNLKPPKGFQPKTVEQRESKIRSDVRARLGQKLEKGVGAAVAQENKKIDQFVDESLKKEQGKTKTTKQEFAQNKEDVTTPKRSGASLRQRNQNRGGRGRR